MTTRLVRFDCIAGLDTDRIKLMGRDTSVKLWRFATFSSQDLVSQVQSTDVPTQQKNKAGTLTR